MTNEEIAEKVISPYLKYLGDLYGGALYAGVKKALNQKDLSLESKLQAGKILSETVEWSLGTLQAIKDARPEIAPTSVAEAIKKCEEAIQSAREKGLV